MHVRDEGQEGLGMTFRFLTGTVGSMVKPCPETGTLAKDQFAGGGGNDEVSFEYDGFECLWGI